MFNDAGLLFDAVAVERLARRDGIAIARKGRPAQRQVPAGLNLPDMHQFVDEMRLGRNRLGCIIGCPVETIGMAPDMAIGRHRHPPRVQRPEFGAPHSDRSHIQRRPEHAGGQFNLGAGQRADGRRVGIRHHLCS